MEYIYFDLNNLPEAIPLSMTLGNFDGFHIGHSTLAYEAFSKSSKLNAILLFSSPYKVFAEGERILTSLQSRIRQAEINRFEAAYILSVSPEFYQLSSNEFESLLHRLGVVELFVGSDYRYGKGAQGDLTSLAKAGFLVHEVPLLLKDGVKVSSREIKSLLVEGRIEEATNLLGRPYEINGTVIHGRKVGRTLGFPTANLELSDPYCIPKEGVYAGRAFVRGIPHFAMISISNNPTFDMGEKIRIEAHLLDFDLDIYGETIYLDFYHRIRDTIKFENAIALKTQLVEDEKRCRDYFLSVK